MSSIRLQKRRSATRAKTQARPVGGGRKSNSTGDGSLPLPKFVTLAPLTVRLRHDQVVMLTDLERKIMSQRVQGQRRERITKSTIIRGLIDLLPELLTDTQGIADEGALQERLRMLVTK